MRLKNPLPAPLHNKILGLIAAGKSPRDVKLEICKDAGISERRAHEYYKHVQEVGLPIDTVEEEDIAALRTIFNAPVKVSTTTTAITGIIPPVTEAVKPTEAEWKSSLFFDGKYVYNKEEDKYIVYLRTANRHIVVPGERHRLMLKAYSNWDGNPATINEICRNFEFPRVWFIEYKTIMGWTHDREPISNEEMETKDEGELVQDLLQQKRFAIFQKFQKEDWKATQEDANKWRSFQAKQLNPFEAALSNWIPPTSLLPLSLSVPQSAANQWFVCGCFDWQIGESADGKYLFRQKDWSTSLAKTAIDNYAFQITNDIASRQQAFSGCEVLLGGDLNHGFHGKTAKGTVLDVDTVKEEQFDALFTSLTYFISIQYQIFGKVNVRAVRGNHEGFDFYPVMKAVEAYFRPVPAIKFHIYSSRTALFRIGPVLVLLDHGASDTFKAEVPRNGKARESYIQSLLLAHPAELVGVKQKIFIQGDKHHYEQMEYNDFEAFMFGALPLGDRYADNLNLHSRPRQNCMIINDSGVKEVLHYYFD